MEENRETDLCEDYEEYKKHKLTSQERVSIMHLDMLQRSISDATEGIKDRLAKTGYKYLNRDIGLINSAMKRMCDAALASTSKENVMMILRQSRDVRLGLEKARVVRQKDEIVMPIDDEWQFVRLVVEGNCEICVKTPAECRACKIRKLLRRYTFEPEPGILSGCGFKSSVMGTSKKVTDERY